MNMRCTTRVAAFAAVVGLARGATAQETLHVMRHAPADTASPSSIITITFDRPIAGALDDSSDAARFVHVTPIVAFAAHWRDPVTIRLIPREPLEPGREYVVDVDPRIRGEDRSRLAAPYRFSFRIKGPRLVAKNFGNYYEPEILAPEPRLLLLYSAPVDVGRLGSGTRVELSGAGCRDTMSIRLKVVAQRPVTPTDPYPFQPGAQVPRDTIAARFARVVELQPASQLPFDCDGRVVVPTTNDDAKYGHEERYRIRTARTFRVTRLDCGGPWQCAPTDIAVIFSTSVPRANAARFIQLDGKPVVLANPNAAAGDSWPLRTDLRPRTAYMIRVDSSMEDIYGRRITGDREWRFETADFAPAIQHARGNVVAATSGSHTFPVRSINTQFIRVIAQRVPDSLRVAISASSGGMDWSRLLRGTAAETTTVELPDRLNVDTTTEVPLPRLALAPDHPLVVVRLEIAQPLPEAIPARVATESHRYTLQRFNPATYYWSPDPLTVQVTDLAVTARLAGETEGSALVTSLTDGRPRPGVTVTQIDATGRSVARGVSNDSGIAALRRIASDSMLPRRTNVTLTPAYPQVKVLYAQAGDDRVAVSLGGRAIGYTPENPLEPSRLGSRTDDGPLAAGAIFADRDIFRPKEVVHLKAVLRTGILGDLRVPSSRDSVRVVVKHRPTSWSEENTAVVRDTVLHLTEFGTAVDSLRLAASPRLGAYLAELQIVAQGDWRTLRSAPFRVEEFRAPTFLVDVATDDITRFPGEDVTAVVSAHYLFGSPAAGTTVQWVATSQYPASPMPVSEKFATWTVGDPWDAGSPKPRRVTGSAKLDASGRATIRIPASELVGPQTRLVQITASVVDVDRQTVTDEAHGTVSADRMFVFVRQATAHQTTGKTTRIDVQVVDRTGSPVADASVRALVVRQYTRALADGSTSSATDTVRTEAIDARSGAGSFSFVLDSAGAYFTTFTATNPRGDATRTKIVTYVSPPAPVVSTLARGPQMPSRTSSFHLAVTCEDKNLRPGSVAHVRFVSPFDSADAWVKTEREGIFDERRQRAVRGENVIDVPIVEKYAPNVIVSVVLLPRPKPARPDSATERLRVGYVDLPIATDSKKLSVALSPDRASYAPQDTASIKIVVRDAVGRGVRSEVALWAIDEGVLALTGFRTPNLLSLVYAPRGIGAPVWSTLPMLLTNDPTLIAMFMRQSVMMLASSVATSAPERSQNAPSAQKDVTRSEFSSSAFYLGTVRTGANGEVLARARVPDNLTTFRVMGVALSAGDKYGNGDTTILVTRPLVARAELPRFVRPSDSIVAGVAVTARDGHARSATAYAEATGLDLASAPRLGISLSAESATEARFVFTAPRRDVIGDSVSVTLGANDAATADATRTWLPVRPDYHPRTHAVLGATRDTQDLVIELPKDIDPRRSRMRLRIGTSHLSAMLAGVKWLIAYRFDCTEQIASRGRAMIAVWNATKRERPDALGGDPHAKLQELADEVSKRQMPSGAIALWPGDPWQSPWLTAHAGLFLLDARDLGVRVDDNVLSRAARYLRASADTPVDTGGMNRYVQRYNRLALGWRVSAVDYLRRAGEADTSAERTLLRVAVGMTWEDRLHLAEVIAPRADMRAAATSLLDAAWRTVIPAGHRVDLPDSSHAEREFPSRIAPAARLLSASLVLRPDHPLIAALTETVLQQGKGESIYAWSTQDYGPVVLALAKFVEDQESDRVVNAHAASRRFVARPSKEDVDTTIAASLDGMLERNASGVPVLRLHVDAGRGARPVYFALEVEEVPLAAPVKPDIHGIVVERWYERYDDGKPVKEVKEGDLVRVQLRVTVPADRQFVVIEDPLPAGLEPIDNSLLTSRTLDAFATPESRRPVPGDEQVGDEPFWQTIYFGGWVAGRWSPWEYRELHDDRVTHFARVLWTGAYTASYVARATLAGNFVAPPAYAEEMYNPALQGRSAGGRFVIRR